MVLDAFHDICFIKAFRWNVHLFHLFCIFGYITSGLNLNSARNGTWNGIGIIRRNETVMEPMKQTETGKEY